MDKIREEFEKRIRGIHKYFNDEPNLEYDSDCNCYKDARLNTLYTFFRFGAKAKLESMAVRIPKNCKGHAITVKEFIDAIESVGIKVVDNEQRN